MSARDFLTNVTIILTVMAIGAVLETGIPMFAVNAWKQRRRTANLGLTALSFFSNWLLASLAAIAALTLRPAGLMAHRGWPLWVEILAGIVIVDFSVGYLSHRTMHMWPFASQTGLCSLTQKSGSAPARVGNIPLGACSGR